MFALVIAILKVTKMPVKKAKRRKLLIASSHAVQGSSWESSAPMYWNMEKARFA